MAIEDFVIFEAGIMNSDTPLHGLRNAIQFSQKLATFNFLLFKEDVDNNNLPYTYQGYYDLADNAFHNNGTDYDHYDTGRYCLSEKPDEKLVQGITQVLLEDNPIDIKKMVDGLFSKDRINTIHNLKTMGSKEQSR